MPVQVPSSSRARELIRQGYRRQPPELSETQPQPLAPAKETTDDKRLNINAASLAELIALEGIGVAIAKKIVTKQGSINSIEDLIEISDRPNWQQLESLIKFA